MLCSISGVVPEEPVASIKTGQIFERRLVEQYIEQNGTEPNVGGELALDDLIPLQTDRNIRPRPPTLTSIPSLLSVFQNEWDALALETHALRQQLLSTRQELSSALYQHDAAVRVIARVTAERDQAREALAQLSFNAPDTSDGPHLNGNGIPPSLAEVVTDTRESLSKTRRKRVPPPNWADEGVIESFTETARPDVELKEAQHLALDADQSLALITDSGGSLIFSLEQDKLVHKLSNHDDPVQQAIWIGDRLAVGSKQGIVRILGGDGSELASFSTHNGSITGLAAHPSGELLVSTASDQSFVIYDLQQMMASAKKRIGSDLTEAAIHPDGALLAIGDSQGNIRAFDLIECTEQAVFEGKGSISRLEFSENGVWLASAAEGDPTISIWDLRKLNMAHSLQIGGAIRDLRWDYTGQFLATAGADGITVQHYSKAKKTWTESLRVESPSRLVSWGPQARSLVIVSDSSELLRLGEA